VPGPIAATAEELTGSHVRRLTRQSTAQRAVTTWATRLADAWSTAASVGIGLALLGGWLASVRDDIAGRAPGAGTSLPAPVTTVIAVVLAAAGLLTLLDRLGPVSSSPAAAAWWLPLPADRGGLLRSELLRVGGVCTLVTALLVTPLTMAGADAPSLRVVAATALGAAAAAGGLVGAVALLQTRGRRGVLAPAAGTVAVMGSAAAAAVAVVPALSESATGWTRIDLPPIGWAPVLAAVLAATVLLAAADRGLGRLDAGSLRTLGATSAYASASVFSLDTRDLGRALATQPRRAPARRRRFRLVRRPWQAVATADLLLMARSRWQCGQLVVATAVPVLAARTQGLDRLPAATGTGLLLGWLAAAVAVGHAARHAQAAPALDRLLPLSPAQVVAARCVAPALLLTVVCGVSGLLTSVGSGSVPAWTALALAAVPAWIAAALRGAYRPELDWSGPVVATPMGVLPAGVGATLVHGIDVGLVGSLPVLGAVLLGGSPSPALIGFQLAWATCLAVGALALLARRHAAPDD
jgi:hypothetical protein